MRLVLLTCCLALLSTASVAADSATPAPAVQPVNTICPVSGEAVDPSVPPIMGKTKDGKTVEIGFCCAKCAAVVAKNPDAYADAASANKKADSGK